ncbi:oxygen-dependent coproporphyrinogen oxidase [Thermaurantiacus sp.]
MDTETRKARASAWFRTLRDQIFTAFEAIEAESADIPVLPGAPAAPGRFQTREWTRTDATGEPGGGGTMGIMKGRVFEKVGVNISTVHGRFPDDFAKTIPGAEDDPSFFATGISLVAHMANPNVPAVHMNTRFLVTTKSWFGGGADLNPALPRAEDTADFHAAFKATCDAHGEDHWNRFSKWCESYFFIPHRNRPRGVGGIFYDYLECPDDAAFEANFAFTRAVGETFVRIFPKIVRRRMAEPWDAEARLALLRYRGLYAEFNLVYDRGTVFGLRTGGNTDAILMSLPPEARWD